MLNFIKLAGFTASALLIGAPVLAQDICETYANNALGAVEKNTEHSCGFLGVHWSNHKDSHLAWCQFASKKDRDYQANLRAFKVEQCIAEKSHPCTAYANRAIERGKINVAKQCGLTEGRFMPSFQEQFDWCYKVAPSVVSEVERSADAAIKQCVEHKG